jgi:hypothetical protein
METQITLDDIGELQRRGDPRRPIENALDMHAAWQEMFSLPDDRGRYDCDKAFGWAQELKRILRSLPQSVPTR